MNYRLLKDLPDVNAGMVYWKTDSGWYTCARSLINFPDGLVENNPDWFEPIDDEKKWTTQDMWASWNASPIRQTKYFTGFDLWIKSYKP